MAGRQRNFHLRLAANDTMGRHGFAAVAVSISAVNRAPAFPTARTSRTIEENNPPLTMLGPPVAATDPDTPQGDTLTYFVVSGDSVTINVEPSTGAVFFTGAATRR